MKRTIFVIAILLAAGTGSFGQVSTTKPPTHKHVTTKAKYTCTMHPEIVRNKPGKCPKCGMPFVKMKPGKMKDMKM